MKIIHDSDERELCRAAAEQINTLLDAWHAEPVLILFSGGSAMAITEGIDVTKLGGHITITLLDERYSRDPGVNNFEKLSKTPFYAHAKEAGVEIIDTRVQNSETQEHLAARFESALQSWVGKYKEGHVLVTLGMGPDGHTAGIMPYPENPGYFTELFEDDSAWVAGYTATGKHIHEERVTTTLSFLRGRVDTAIGYITGETKREAMRRVLAASGTLHATPARIIHEMKDVHLYTTLAV